MKKIFAFVFLLFLVPVLVWGAEFHAGESYSLSVDKRIAEDAYMIAGTVTTSGEVSEDITALGGTITIAGPIGSDAMVGGGQIHIAGNIGDDLRIVGGNVVVAGNVGGDVVVVGGQAHVISGSLVNGDVLLIAGNVVIEGDVRGNVRLIGGNIFIDGSIDGDVKIFAEEVALGERARINGTLEYTAQKEATIAQGAAVRGGVEFHQKMIRDDKRVRMFGFALFASVGFLALLKSLAFILGALLVVLVMPKISSRVVERAHHGFWKEVLRGFILGILVPISLLVAFITIVGFPIGLIMLSWYIAFMTLGWVYAGVLFGTFLYRWFKKKTPTEATWKLALLGSFILPLSLFIPVLGVLASLIFFLAAFGSIAHVWYEYIWIKR